GHSLWRRPGADQRFQLRFSGVINRQSGGGRKHDPIESWPAYVVNSYVGRDTSMKSSGLWNCRQKCTAFLAILTNTRLKASVAIVPFPNHWVTISSIFSLAFRYSSARATSSR